MTKITYFELWDDLLGQNDNDIDKTATAMLDAITGGIWAVWDGEKIDRLKAELIDKFNKEDKNGTRE